MKFKASLNLRFYICTILLLGITVFGWYALWFLNANEILMEDNTPMDLETKRIFTIIMGIVILSWTASLFVLVRQIFLNKAFWLDGEGIHQTLTAVNILAFIFIVPIKTIPFSAINKIYEENGILTAEIDKAQLDMPFLYRLLTGKKYHFFKGFTTVNQDEIKDKICESYNFNIDAKNDS